MMQHVPAGHANGGQFTSPRANPPRPANASRKGYERLRAGNTAPILKPFGKDKSARARAEANAAFDASVARRMAEGKPKSARKVKASAPPAEPKPKRTRKPKEPALHYGPRPTSPSMYRDYHQEVELDLARALQSADDAEREGSWTHAEAQKARGVAKRMATNEHKKVPGWTPPAKPAPKPRKRKASAPARTLEERYRMTPSQQIANANALYNQEIAHYGAGLPADAEKRLRALRDKRIREARKAAQPPKPARKKRTRRDIWLERNPGVSLKEYVPRQGSKRTRRTKVEVQGVYMDARGQRLRRARVR